MPIKMQADLLWSSNDRAMLGENPLWDSSNATLYWIDVVTPAVLRLTDGVVTRFALPKPVAAIFLSAPDRLLVAMRQTFAELNLLNGQLTQGASVAPPSADERFNDGRCDRAGRLWISTMDRKLERTIGSLLLIDEAGTAASFATGAKLGNGVCFSPDHRWVYFSDTAKRSIVRYPSALPAAMQAQGELLIELDEAPGRPDGCSVDADGCLWSARVGGGRIDRYAPDGTLLGTLQMPVSHPTHCTFGGPALSTLFVTSARHPASSPEFAHQPLAGAVLAFDVGVPGLPEPRLSPVVHRAALDGASA